jgi:glutamate/tyrosine decarboxylase-like PLP-dependent enzyme
MEGIESADSITFDPHKTLVPLGSGGCGMFLTPHRSSVARSFNVSGGKPKTHDYAYMSLQGSRALSGLRTMVHFADLEALARRVDREAALGNRLRRKLRQAGWLITNTTPLPVICTIHPKLVKRGIDAGRIVQKLAEKGIYAKPAALRPDEPESVRLGIISRRTKEEDVDYVVSELEALV